MCIKNYISKSSHFKTSPIMTFLRDQLWLDNDKNVQTWDETHIIIYCRIFIAKSHHPVHTQSHTHTVYTFRLLIHLSHSPDTHIHTLLAGEGLCGISESFGRAENLTDADQQFYIYQVLFINFFFSSFLFFDFLILLDDLIPILDLIILISWMDGGETHATVQIMCFTVLAVRISELGL